MSAILEGTPDKKLALVTGRAYPEQAQETAKYLGTDVLETTGCGDSFMGTVLAGLASGMTLSQSAELASYVSAYAATGYGAQASYGTAAQIREAFADAE